MKLQLLLLDSTCLLMIFNFSLSLMVCKLIFFALQVLFSICSSTFTVQRWFRLALEMNIQTLIHLLLYHLHSYYPGSAPPVFSLGLTLLLSVRFSPVSFCIATSCKPHNPPVMPHLKELHHWIVLIFSEELENNFSQSSRSLFSRLQSGTSWQIRTTLANEIVFEL